MRLTVGRNGSSGYRRSSGMEGGLPDPGLAGVRSGRTMMLRTMKAPPMMAIWRNAQFDTIRLALIKVAGRVTEMVTRIKVALPSAYTYQESLAVLAARAIKLPP